ncbi:MAG: hypothetical protein V3S81_02465, partial [Anaerolineales bacterium]
MTKSSLQGSDAPFAPGIEISAQENVSSISTDLVSQEVDLGIPSDLEHPDRFQVGVVDIHFN